MKNQKSKSTNTNSHNSPKSTKPFFSKDSEGSFFSKGNFFGQGDFFKPAVQMKRNEDLPEDVQFQMESSFSQDLSNVKIHKNSRRAKELNAHAFTEGNDVHIADGKYNPTTNEGKALIGHELTHVIQQKSGRVSPTVQFNRIGINTEDHLEKEADTIGERVANGSLQNISSQKNNEVPFYANSLKGNNVVTQRKCTNCKQKTEESTLQESHKVIQLSGDEEGFFDYFHQCMDDLGLPAPRSLFTSIATATATIAAMNNGVRLLTAASGATGTVVTIGQLIQAGILSEALKVIAALSASYYAGACIGCLATATGQSLSGGYSLGEAIYDLVHDVDESRYTEQRGVVRRGIRREREQEYGE